MEQICQVVRIYMRGKIYQKLKHTEWRKYLNRVIREATNSQSLKHVYERKVHIWTDIKKNKHTE